MDTYPTFFTLALAVSAISMTVSKAVVFKGLRSWTRGHLPWLGKLMSCPYCTSHWVSFAIVGLYRPSVVNSGFWAVDLFVTALALVAVAAPVSGLIFFSFRFMPEEKD